MKKLLYWIIEIISFIVLLADIFIAGFYQNCENTLNIYIVVFIILLIFIALSLGLLEYKEMVKTIRLYLYQLGILSLGMIICAIILFVWTMNSTVCNPEELIIFLAIHAIIGSLFISGLIITACYRWYNPPSSSTEEYSYLSI